MNKHLNANRILCGAGKLTHLDKYLHIYKWMYNGVIRKNEDTPRIQYLGQRLLCCVFGTNYRKLLLGNHHDLDNINLSL